MKVPGHADEVLRCVRPLASRAAAAAGARRQARRGRLVGTTHARATAVAARRSAHNRLCSPRRGARIAAAAPVRRRRPLRDRPQEAHGRAQDPSRAPHPRRPQVRQSLAQVRPGHPPRPGQQAVRARHQRADARPDEPVPVRGARHLPADPHARGARQQQEGRHRGRAQRAPGVALPRRARDRAADDGIAEGIPLDAKSGGAATGRLLPADRGDHDRAAAVARQRQGRQPDPRRRHAPAAPAPEAQRHPGVEGHQHADQGARAGHRRRGLLQRQGARGHRPPLQRHARAARRLLGPARQGHGVVAAGRPHVLPDHRAARAVAARQRVPLPGEARRARRSTRMVKEITGTHRGAADAEGLHAPEEQRLGHHRAQPRAELRAQPADEPGRSTSSRCSARPAPARRC